MLRLHPLLSAECGLAVACACACFALDVRDARACGGCFHERRPVTVVDTSFVTDHRMAFSMSPAQTVLWDQVRYTGNPKNFAWVLPVKPGARIELSHDAWIAALDASTRTVITGPTPPSCGGGAPTEYTSGGGGGCGAGFGGSSYAVPDGVADASAGRGTDQVQVISQQVVGPYDAVTVRSSQGNALGDWLRANGYDLPASIQPTIDAYSSAGFDFIALKLAPTLGVQAMRPVRIVTPGADPTLPLRMVAAGVGAHVGLELYVLSEGRYHPANFPDATIDFTRLAWDPTLGRSNYTDLAQQSLAAGNGTGWLTESSALANLYGLSGPNLGLEVLYRTTCTADVFVPTCPGTAGGVAATTDAGSTIDAGSATDAAAAIDVGSAMDAASATDVATRTDAAAMTDAASASDAAAAAETGVAGDAAGASDSRDAGDDGADSAVFSEAGGPSMSGGDAGACAPPMVQTCDDLSVALVGIASGNLWVTRLRADFPSAALANDLVLEATNPQTPVPNQHTTNAYTIPNYDPCASAPKSPPSMATSSPTSSPSSSGCACRTGESPRGRYADAILLSMGVAGLALSLRRRRAKKGS